MFPVTFTPACPHKICRVASLVAMVILLLVGCIAEQGRIPKDLTLPQADGSIDVRLTDSESREDAEALLKAVRKNDVMFVQDLLEAGVDANTKPG